MTPEQRDRLAKQVDVSLITHQDHDHADYSLSKRMLEMGKAVIGPDQLRNLWKDIGPKITVPEYETFQKFDPCEIFTTLGYQYGSRGVDEEGTKIGVPHPEPGHDNESVVFLIKMGNIIFLQAAENHMPYNGWLKKAEDAGWKVNAIMQWGMYQASRSVRKFLKNYFALLIHEYEMMHDGGGNRTTHLLTGNGLRGVEEKRMMPLWWGEDFLFTRQMLEWTY